MAATRMYTLHDNRIVMASLHAGEGVFPLEACGL